MQIIVEYDGDIIGDVFTGLDMLYFKDKQLLSVESLIGTILTTEESTTSICGSLFSISLLYQLCEQSMSIMNVLVRSYVIVLMICQPILYYTRTMFILCSHNMYVHVYHMFPSYCRAFYKYVDASYPLYTSIPPTLSVTHRCFRRSMLLIIVQAILSSPVASYGAYCSQLKCWVCMQCSMNVSRSQQLYYNYIYLNRFPKVVIQLAMDQMLTIVATMVVG